MHAYTMIYTVRPMEIMVVDPPPHHPQHAPHTDPTDHRFYAFRVRDFTVKPASPLTFYFTVKFV